MATTAEPSKTAERVALSRRRGPSHGGAPGWVQIGVFGFAVLFVLSFTQADRWLDKAGWFPLRPTWVFALVMVPLAAYAVLRDLRSPPLPTGALHSLLRARLLVIPFALLSVLALLWSLHPTANWSRGGSYVLLVPFDFGVFLLALLVGSLARIRQLAGRLAMIAGATLLFTLLVDLLAPGSFSSQASRAAGLAENSNVSAFLLLSAVTLCLSYGSRRIRDLSLLGVAALAVLLTLSRTGLLLLLAVFGTYGLIVSASQARFRYRRLLPIGVATAILVSGLALARQLVDLEVGVFSRSVAQRRVSMLTDPTAFIADDDSRLGLARHYGGLISDAPFVGHGTGYSYRLIWGPHNRFLQTWTNLGLPGLLCYVSILLGALALFLARRNPAGICYVVLLCGWSLFSHGVLEQRSVPMVLGLLAAGALERREELPGGGAQDAAPVTGRSVP